MKLAGWGRYNAVDCAVTTPRNEEDLAWAMHGHSHDSIDHDHSQAVVPGPDLSPQPLDIYRTAWRLSSATSNTLRINQIERPPRV